MLSLSRWKPYGLLLALCLAMHLPGMASIPPIDRDEARFAQASRQMVESGDFVRIRFQDEPRYKKPIGIYWLQSAMVETLGGGRADRIWLYRMPSLLGATLAVLMTFAFGRKLFDERTALLGAALTGASLLLTVEAHQATTDAALLACVTAAQGSLGLMHLRRGPDSGDGIWLFMLFWLAQAAGILIKGPIAPVASALTILALVILDKDRKWLKGLRPIAGLSMTALLVLPWFVAIMHATQGSFIAESVGKDLLPKLAGGQESHGFFPGYYLLLLPITFWPGILFLGFAAPWAWKNRRLAEIRFCLCWIIPLWLLFELVPTKLPHYVLPTFPALGLLVAASVLAHEGDAALRMRSWPAKAGIFLWGLVSVALGAGALFLPVALHGSVPPAAGVPAATALVALILAVRRLKSGRIVAASVVSIGCSLLVLASIFQFILPNADALWISRSVASAIERQPHSTTDAPVAVAAVGYHEPSLVFLLGADTELASQEQAAGFLAGRPGGFVVVSEKDERDFLDSMARLGKTPALLDSVRGFNYSKGRWMTLKIYTCEES